MRVILGALLTLMMSSQTVSACANHLLSQKRQIRIQKPADSNARLEVRVQLATEKWVPCRPVPTTQERLVRRLVETLNERTDWSTAALVEFTTSAWHELSLSASIALLKIANDTVERIEPNNAARISHLIAENRVPFESANKLILMLSRLPSKSAVTQLTTILEHSGRTRLKLAAARSLGKQPPDSARAILERCSKRNDRLVSAQCRRSLIRWHAQHAKPRVQAQ